MLDLRATDPRDDKTRIEQTKGGLFKDSYRWILKNDDFQRWRHGDDQQSRLLWIKGDPGKGKTMLLCGIIDELESATGDGVLSYFFCQGTDSRINNAVAVLRGLIFLLVDQQQSLISHVQKKYEYSGKKLFEDKNTWAALTKIFGDILHDPSLRSTCFIIDALDECMTDLPQLLDLIMQHSSVPNVKWILSSRNRHDIEQKLVQDESRTRLSLELNAEHVSCAVDAYIDHRVSGLASVHDDKALQDQLRDQMRQKANGTFLWVALVSRELQTVESWNVLQVIEQTPTDLIALYDRMMTQILQFKHNSEFCRLVLSTATSAYRPLHLRELGVLSGLPRDISSRIRNVERITDMCGSFLTTRNSYVYLIHQSAKDYLNTNASATIFPSGRADIHYGLFSRSLQVMSETLHRDMYRLRDPGILIDQVIQPEPDPLVQARYSCVYWVDHFYNSDRGGGLQQGGKVDKFLRLKYLYWLEALSLLGNMSEGVLSILKLERLLLVSINDFTIPDICTNFSPEKGRRIPVDKPSSRYAPVYSVAQTSNREYSSPDICVSSCI